MHELGLKAGVTLNPATPTAALAEGVRYADLVLCMSVNPGWGGQSFIEASVERLRELGRMLRPGTALEVDGGVGPQTIARVHEAGANLLVAGSAIYGQPSPGDAYRALVAAVS
jgi:ribulose-phosphate 3-epimerase